MPVDSFSVNPFVGFGCAGYRSFFGTEPARMGPFDKVQVISGQNNCGKSALVDFLVKVIKVINERGEIRREDNPLAKADIPLSMTYENELPLQLSHSASILMPSKKHLSLMLNPQGYSDMGIRFSSYLTALPTLPVMAKLLGLISLLIGSRNLSDMSRH